MRELKFRAWDNEDKELIYDLQHCPSGYPFGDYIYDDRFSDVMQFTGLKDKNETDIYEGDIVQYHGIGNDDIGVVKFGEAGDYEASFLIKSLTKPNYNYTLMYPECQSYEILGNIYENPKLAERS